jgi:hypothetical protein
MTAGPPFTSCRVVVDEAVFPLPPSRPSELLSCCLAVRGAVSAVRLEIEGFCIDVPLLPAELPIVDQLWAHEKLTAGSGEDLALAAAILTPEGDAVAAVNRDEDIEGDVTHIDTQLASTGVGWDPEHSAAPVVLVRPPIGIRGRQISAGVAAPEMHRRPPGSVVVTENRMFVGRMPGSAAPAAPAIVRAEGVKPALFLLRLLEQQELDGSWREEARLKISCGCPIPEDSMGLDRVVFLTAFVIVCLRIGAPKSEEQWELVAEKGILFLRERDPGRDWDETFAAIQARLAQ